MNYALEIKKQEIESELNSLREKLDELSDNDIHQLSRIQQRISELSNELNNMHKYAHLIKSQ